MSTRLPEGRHPFSSQNPLQQTLARYQRVLASSNDGIWEWYALDANTNPRKAGRVSRLYTSQSFWRDFGYSDAEIDAIPENERLAIWYSHVHPHDLPELERAFKQYLQSRGPFDFEYRILCNRGRVRWLRARGTGVFNSHGRMILMSGININITELKESEHRVGKAREEAERANRSKSGFLSSVSHELRTPLNAILGFSQLLSVDSSLNSTQREHANTINEAGQHLLRLINGVLDLAQIEAGKLSLSLEYVQPAALVMDAFNYCKTLARDRNITLHLDAGNLKESTLYLDPTRFRQCLLNLLSNAIKYNVDGGRVNVIFTEHGEHLEISVQDTGPGIASERSRSLFEMFNRLGAERSGTEGSGVGLVITRELVTAMRGSIYYNPESGPGACFTLRFPMISRHSARPFGPGLPNKEKQPVFDPGFSEPKTVFYIEDNPSNIRLLDTLLKPYPQLNLLSQTDPLTGLYQMRCNPPDMVILDINLPHISGYEVLKILKRDPLTQRLPVIALSASVMEHDIQKGAESGFDEYLTKPLDLEKLAAIFNRFFAQQEN